MAGKAISRAVALWLFLLVVGIVKPAVAQTTGNGWITEWLALIVQNDPSLDDGQLPNPTAVPPLVSRGVSPYTILDDFLTGACVIGQEIRVADRSQKYHLLVCRTVVEIVPIAAEQFQDLSSCIG